MHMHIEGSCIRSATVTPLRACLRQGPGDCRFPLRAMIRAEVRRLGGRGHYPLRRAANRRAKCDIFGASAVNECAKGARQRAHVMATGGFELGCRSLCASPGRRGGLVC